MTPNELIKAISEARRIYRITESALYRAEREGRHKAVKRLAIRLQQRFDAYNRLVNSKFGGAA
jgi:transcription elongation GreA/GreB family factor